MGDAAGETIPYAGIAIAVLNFEQNPGAAIGSLVGNYFGGPIGGMIGSAVLGGMFGGSPPPPPEIGRAHV